MAFKFDPKPDSKSSAFEAFNTSNTGENNIFQSKSSESASSPFAFGAKTQSTDAQPNTQTNLFSNTTAPTSSASLTGGANATSSNTSSFSFGTKTTTDQAKPIFGSSSTTGAFAFNKPAEPSKLSATTSTSNETKQSTPFAFGSSLGSGSSAPLFGSESNKPTFSLSSAPKEDEEKGSSSLSFGPLKTASTTESKPLFGATASTPASTATTESKPLFSGLSTTTSSTESKPLFGAASTESKPLFGGISTESKPLFGSSTSTTTTSSTSKPLFGASTTTTTTSSESKPLFGTATASTTAEDAAKSKPLFGASTTTSAPAPSTTTAAVAAPVTNTPAPEITPSLFLKNRSFEDIISKWSSSLTRSKEGFKAQAAEIRKWDRDLVKNGERITTLYNDVVLAEQNQGRIDQLLEYIERQQKDLEQMLDVYDSQADALMANFAGKEGLQPIDQERERTYKLAEDLDGKLDSMGQNLSGIIDEINKVGHELNHAHDDDPVTQIVKILNAQLSSLQWIDTNTDQLQKDVDRMKQLGAQTKDGLQSYENFRTIYS